MGRLPVHNKSSHQCEDLEGMWEFPMMCDDSDNVRVLPHCKSKCSHNVEVLPRGGVACMAQTNKF